MELLQREVHVSKTLDHPFIACVFDAYQESDFLYLVTELIENGTLGAAIARTHGFPEDEARRVFYEFIHALRYLHEERHVCHRDIKADNILLDRNGHIRLTDFGFARFYESESSLMRTTCGSPAYVSPEIIRGGGYTAASDLWSAGVLLYIMLTGDAPFRAANSHLLFTAILTQDPTFPSEISREGQAIIGGLLKKDASERLSIERLFAHPWLATCASPWDVYLDRMRVVSDRELDRIVVQEMRALNLETENLLGELERGEMIRTTAVYKMLKRQKHTEELRMWEARRTGEPSGGRIPLKEGGSFTRSCEPATRGPIHPTLMMGMRIAHNAVGLRGRPLMVPVMRKLTLTRQATGGPVRAV
jgi:hypothetical protein